MLTKEDKRRAMNMRYHKRNIDETASTKNRLKQATSTFVQTSERYRKKKKVDDQAGCQQLTGGFYFVRLTNRKSRQGSYVGSWNYLLPKRTVQQVMAETPSSKYQKFKRAPSPTADLQKNLLDWITRFILCTDVQWQNLIFSDKK